MYNQPYFIPGYFPSSVAPSMMRGGISGAMNGARLGAMGNAMNGARLGAQGASRGLGLFSRLGNSFSAIKSINWGSLITNTSKTLNVVNQAIPLVRQVGPMVNNVKSMLRVASIFKDETDKKPTRQRAQNSSNTGNYTNRNTNTAYINPRTSTNPTNNNNLKNHSTSISDTDTETRVSANNYDGSPTFFVSS
ncbi:MAG: hypothetical protein IJ509_02630 [Bacilli bacterium]|nr:hypothetical protein [Bacilli bacterium]